MTSELLDDKITAELLDDKIAFADLLAETFEPRDVVRLLLATGLRHSDLALALNVHPRTVRAWMDDETRDMDRHRDGILSLKALILFLLRRGILTPRQLALWLVEPQEALDFRRPLAVFAEKGLHAVVSASAAVVRPEPALGSGLPPKAGVAAGAANRETETQMNETTAVAGATSPSGRQGT